MQENLIEGKRQTLRKKLEILQSKNTIHTKLSNSIKNLRTKLEDDRSELNATYLHYIVWFLAAGVMTAVATHQLKKRFTN